MLSGRPLGFNSSGLTWMPALDVEETDSAFRLAVEVPGVSPNDLEVTVENGVLTVSGERKFDREEGDEQSGSHFVERRYGRFERSVQLPEYADADHVSANYENGVLAIEIPKTAAAKPRKIEIRRGSEQNQLASGSASASAKEQEQQESRKRERQVA